MAFEAMFQPIQIGKMTIRNRVLSTAHDEVYATDGDTHTAEYTLVYLPRARILVEADAYNPGPPDAPPPANPPPNAVKLFEESERLKLRVTTIAPIHGRGAVPIAELRKFIGRG